MGCSFIPQKSREAKLISNMEAESIAEIERDDRALCTLPCSPFRLPNGVFFGVRVWCLILVLRSS